jgi:hypothetical protein
MTKEQLIKFMADWPEGTIVRISSWPFICDVQAVQCVPENGRASILAECNWFMMENRK